MIVAGWSGATEATVKSLVDDGTVVVAHDLDRVHDGIVRRTVTTKTSQRSSILELAHGCVTCTLREDLLPMLRKLSRRSSVQRIVLALDRVLEPEAVCWAIEHVAVAGVVGQLDGPAIDDVRVDAVLTCLDAATWLADATADDVLADRGVRSATDDDRTVAQLVVGQVSFADALVISGAPTDPWEEARLTAVIARLAPRAPIVWAGANNKVDAETLLRSVPADSRRAQIDDAHGPLLRGQPPLGSDAGVEIVEFTADRPFHPGRLHDAIDSLLDGVVTARGRVWVATQPDRALWLQSAGGGLRIGDGGRWLAAMTDAEQGQIRPDRRAMAAARWDDRFGDRDTSIVVLVHAADPSEITRALQWALVTDEELRRESEWPQWHDPFGSWHEDPCGTSESPYIEAQREDQA